MGNNYLKMNINYLLDNKIITANKLLEITGHNSNGLVYMWKSGERIMRTEDCIKVANYLNITIDDLVNKDMSNDLPESSIIEVKQKIRTLPASDMSEEGKESLLNMVDTLHNMSKKG